MRCPVRCCAAPECMQGRCVWLGEYLPRQRWINAYAQSVGVGEQVFRYAHPEEVERFLQVGPCKECPVEQVCDLPCPEYVRWWDMRMGRYRSILS